MVPQTKYNQCEYVCVFWPIFLLRVFPLPSFKKIELYYILFVNFQFHLMFYNHLSAYISQSSYLQATKVYWLKWAEKEFIKRISSCSWTHVENWRIRARAPWPKISPKMAAQNWQLWLQLLPLLQSTTRTKFFSWITNFQIQENKYLAFLASIVKAKLSFIRQGNLQI